MSQPPKRFLFLPPNDPVIESYRGFFENTINSKIDTIFIDVPPVIVDEGYVEKPQQIVLALQHYPQYIEELLFSIDLKFEEPEGGGIYIPPMEWKSLPKYMRWFREMGAFPAILFFLNDADVRFYILAGDLLADGNLPTVEYDEKRGRVKAEASGPVAEQIFNRLFESCILMLYYCYGSGFDPKVYIESVMAENNAPFTYEYLLNVFNEEIKKGSGITVVRGTKK